MSKSGFGADRVKAWLRLAGTVCGLVCGSFAAGSALLGSVVTTEKIAEHDAAHRAHPPIHEAVLRCETKAVAAESRIEELRSDQVAMGARMVRMISAEIEPRAALRAARASLYEDQYRGLVHRGMPVEEAMLEALRSPWINRPR